MKIRTLLTVVIPLTLVLAWAPLSHALVEVELLSPTTCIRDKGKPVTETFTFTGLAGQAQLQLINGSLEDPSVRKITSARIWVNGQIVCFPQDLNDNVSYLEASLSLVQGENTLKVFLKEKRAGRVTIRIVQEVDADGARVVGPEGGVVEVTDSASPLFGVRIDIPEGACPVDTLVSVSETTFDIPVSEKQEVVSIAPSIRIEPGNVTLGVPCTITVPYADVDNDGIVDGTSFSERFAIVFFQVNDNDEILRAADYGVDVVNNEITILSNHFSKWKFLGQRWKPGVTVYYYVESVPANADYGENFFKMELDKAFAIWQAALSDEVLFESTDDDNNNDVTITIDDFCSGLDFKKCGATAAHGRNPLSTTGKSKIYFNTNIDNANDTDKPTRWAAGDYCTYPPNQNWSWVAFRRAALHEIGHSLGLGEYSWWWNNKRNHCEWYSCSDNDCEDGDKIIMYYDIPFTAFGYPFTRLSCFDVNEVRDEYELEAQDDSDGDGFGDLCDVCPDTADPDQADSDGDGTGDACEGACDEPEQKLTASDGAAKDFFGRSVSISGDYAIVGAYLSNGKAGSAYIFKRSGGSWAQLTKLVASDVAADDRFGHSVSISGDYAIVGAYGDDDNGLWSGSAYIFKRSDSSWTQVAKLAASDGAASDWFGTYVSISGDYAIVGAYGDDDNGYSSGSAYIFKRSGGSWTQVAKLAASDGAAYDYFGYSVCISGDYAVVGAFGNDNYTGSAYIFKRSNSSWTQVAKLAASDVVADDRFGRSVSISGDYAIAGAYREGEGVQGPGTAYIFKRSGGLWPEVTKLISDGAADDFFGSAVSISGDYAIVGAYEDDDNGYHSGSAYIFKRSGGSWTKAAKLTASDGAADDRFGLSVSISGDSAIVGAWGDDDNGSLSGSAYMYCGW